MNYDDRIELLKSLFIGDRATMFRPLKGSRRIVERHKFRLEYYYLYQRLWRQTGTEIYRSMFSGTERWTLEKCQIEAKKYKTRAEWKDSCRKSYDAASRRKWFKHCTKHMGLPYQNTKRPRNQVKNLDTGRVFTSANAAAAWVGLRGSTSICNVCRGTQKTAGGYRWAYVAVDKENK